MDSTIIGRQDLIVMRVFIAERRNKKLVRQNSPASQRPPLGFSLYKTFALLNLLFLVYLRLFLTSIRIADKILASFAIFAKFVGFSKPLFPFVT